VTVPIIVTTSDNYLPALKPFAWLAEKYWRGSAQFTIMGFTKPDFPLPDRFKFVSVGKPEDYPIEKWSDAVIDFLKKFKSPYFIFMLEDYWITRDVNIGAVRLAHKYMELHPNILKFDLTGDRLYAGGADLNYDTFGWLDIVLSDRMSAYQMSLMTGLWRRELFLRAMQKGWNPWEVELEGTTKLQGMNDIDVVGSRQWPIKHTLAFRSGDSKTLKLEEVKQEDVYSLKRLGYLKPWGI
jgi:hypothetical protein